jgi:hypothetical protein
LTLACGRAGNPRTNTAKASLNRRTEFSPISQALSGFFVLCGMLLIKILEATC